jgi:hypothetical protein
MRTVKEVIDVLSALNQDDKIWCIWVDKEELAQILTDCEYEDEDGNLVVVKPKELSNDFIEDVMQSVDNSDHVWDRFADEVRDETRSKWEALHEQIAEAKEDTELWDKE